MFAGRLCMFRSSQSLIPMKRLLVQVTLGFVEESDQFDCTCFLSRLLLHAGAHTQS